MRCRSYEQEHGCRGMATGLAGTARSRSSGAEGFYEDAVSRAYYATLHAAKAALFIHDVATESHATVRRMFGLHLIRSSEIESMWSSNLGESLDDRLAAGYDASTSLRWS